MAQKALYEEVIEEIGTQTLVRFGLNIFSLNTYAAYGSSVQMTLDTNKVYNQHKNNPKYFGHTFEELDTGEQNIKDSLLNSGNKTYTTDTLYDIKSVQQGTIKDKEREQYILAYYGDEVENMDFAKLAHIEAADTKQTKSLHNHTTTDVVTLDKNGNVIKTAQLKVVKEGHTNDLLEDRYLYGEASLDELRVPFDEYKRHKAELEKKIERGKNKPHDAQSVRMAQKAKIALEKLNASNTCNRLMAENPRTTAVLTQSIAASGHIAQAGFSDAIVVTLSMLANGIIWEVKDMFSGKVDSETSIMTRIKRLLQKVKEAFLSNFARGAGFGAIDVAVGIIGQIFKSVAGSLKQFWSSLRTAAKSIYNGIYSYIKGEIKDFQTLVKTILKSLFSVAFVVGAIGLEEQLKATLLTIIPPLAPFIAPVLAIVATSFAVVVTSRSTDMAVDSLFGAFAARNAAKLRAEEIADLIAEKLPALMENREQLERLIEKTHRERLIVIESSFKDYQLAYASNTDDGFYNALNGICNLYGETLSIKDMNDVRQTLENKNRTGKLQW